jgi:nucleotide-binding universal stress UspA family protein
MFRTILTAVDFSEMSKAVLHYAARLAATSPGAQLVVINVVPDPLREPWMVEAIGLDFMKVQNEWMADAELRLNHLIEQEGLAPGKFTPVVVVGRPADAIIDVARDFGVDAIVIGTHGYGPVKHFVLGSVAERVLRHADCPVIAVPEKSVVKVQKEARALHAVPAMAPAAS